MKRIHSFAACAAAIICLGACNKNLAPAGTPEVSEDFIKEFSLSLSNDAVKSSAAAAGESVIEEATVFVYQKNGSTDEETLYQTVHTRTGDINIPLLFNNLTEFTYRFDAYANLGELSQKPDDILFSNEAAERFQMHGTLEEVSQEDVAQATVQMKRYAARVIVNSVKLNWKNEVNASQAFTLKRIWLANTAEVSGGNASYNLGGVWSSSQMDGFLISEVNQVIGHGEKYDIPHYLYGYGAEGSSLVLECQWAGRTMYYHVDCPLSANSSTIYNFSIHQTGSDEPLGDITDDALTSVGAIEAADWSISSSNIWLGEEKYPGTSELPPHTAMILRTNNRFYTPEEWIGVGAEQSEAVGVAISDGTHSLVVHPKKGNAVWDSTQGGIEKFDGMVLQVSAAEAARDFSGEKNTKTLLAAYNAGTLNDISAVRIAANTVFANGKTGYLPAAGELKLIEDNWGSEESGDQGTFYHCMAAIGGDTDVEYACSSTLMSLVKCWYWHSGYSSLSSTSINDEHNFHIVCTLD